MTDTNKILSYIESNINPYIDSSFFSRLQKDGALNDDEQLLVAKLDELDLVTKAQFFAKCIIGDILIRHSGALPSREKTIADHTKVFDNMFDNLATCESTLNAIESLVIWFCYSEIRDYNTYLPSLLSMIQDGKIPNNVCDMNTAWSICIDLRSYDQEHYQNNLQKDNLKEVLDAFATDILKGEQARNSDATLEQIKNEFDSRYHAILMQISEFATTYKLPLNLNIVLWLHDIFVETVNDNRYCSPIFIDFETFENK